MSEQLKQGASGLNRVLESFRGYLSAPGVDTTLAPDFSGVQVEQEGLIEIDAWPGQGGRESHSSREERI